MDFYKRYLDTKSKNADALILTRVGDFYEFFGPDAITASEVLSLTLTSRDCGESERVPMCGVPHHSADIYIQKLIEQGFKVAIFEPLKDGLKTENNKSTPSARLNLAVNGTEQELIKDFLENNVSEVLADKINNGVPIEKDGKQLISKKDLNTFMQYACDEAKNQAAKGARFACIDHQTVFGWAIHYFEEDSIEGTLYNEDGTEYKLPKPVITKAAAPKAPEKPKPKNLSFFDMLDSNTAVEPEPDDDDDPLFDDIDNEAIDDRPEDGQEPVTRADLFDDEPAIAEPDPDDTDDLIQISETQFVDKNGVIYDVDNAGNDESRATLTRLLGNIFNVR